MASIPINYVDTYLKPNPDPLGLGIYVQEAISSDGCGEPGSPLDLQQVNVSEQIGDGDQSGIFNNSSLEHDTSGYLPAMSSVNDRNGVPLALLGTGTGVAVYYQTHTFQDFRTGVTDIPVQNSGFIISFQFILGPTFAAKTGKSGSKGVNQV